MLHSVPMGQYEVKDAPGTEGMKEMDNELNALVGRGWAGVDWLVGDNDGKQRLKGALEDSRGAVGEE